MKEHEPNRLLSVAIPTKNRQRYLKVLVDELLLSTRDNFEIVIQDNSDDDSLGAWVTDKNDPRLKYHYHSGWISVVENCDQAVRQCTGAYICMLGDDDGIMLDEALAYLAQARERGVEAIMSGVLNYVWPDLSHPIFNGYGGKLHLQLVKGLEKSNDFRALARKVVSHGGALGLEDLPCVYQGFISREAMTRLYDLAGSYFPGPSPDMANAIGLCAALKNLEHTKEVLIITGHSALSTAGAGTLRRHHGAVTAQSHLPLDTAESWSAEIPFFWSGPTIYAQSLQRALERTRNTDLGLPNMACVYAGCLVFHGEYWPAVLKAMNRHQGSKGKLFAQILTFITMIWLRRLKNLIAKLASRLPAKHTATANADSIAAAVRIIRSMHHDT